MKYIIYTHLRHQATIAAGSSLHGLTTSSPCKFHSSRGVISQ